MGSTRRRTRLGLITGAVTLLTLMAALLSACGGSGGGSTQEVTAEAGSSGGGSTLVEESKAVASSAKQELMFATEVTPTKPSQIVPYGDWRGPEEAPAHEPSETIEVVLCSKAAPTCVQAGEAVAEAADVLGWKTDIIDGEGTPQGFAQAYTTALSRKPAAIVGIAVPAAAIGKQLAEAKSRGIVTVQTGSPPPESGPRAEAYVPFPMSPMAALIGWSMIGETEGSANAIVITDPTFPEIVESSAALKSVLEGCEGCQVSMLEQPFTDAINPTKVNANIRGALAQDPNAEYLYSPYSAPLAAEVQAIQSAGKSDQVKIVTKNADPIELAAVREGTVAYAAGSSVPWAAWASVDEVIRGLAGAPYLEGTETGLAIALFDKTNAPASKQMDDWSQMVDFRAEYKRIWK